ncbi:MAG: hypothetical protein H8E80_00220 [Desulfobacteraceae bacterium]|uniref:Ion channel n=1 Tax=Candidatus Desulfaltia bathyphila TaxID=2841697 RepID=A0A8J6T5J3_9BACT|nr:hypothetical protein [Candidatus Desulfaltia bathyphila]MBL7195490.1 hypothetical protein [Desulfobacterales bacterium]
MKKAVVVMVDVLRTLFITILNNKFYILSMILWVLFVSLIAFGCWYYFLDKHYRRPDIIYKGKLLRGFVIKGKAFILSDILKQKREVTAKNALRIRDFIGDNTNVSWQSFLKTRLFLHMSPDQKEKMEEFHDIQLLGVSVTEMVEEIFKHYGLLKFSIITYQDNSIEQTFPRSIAAQFLKKPISLIDKQLRNGSATDFEKRLFVELQRVAKILRKNIFQDGKKGNLAWLSKHLKTIADSIEKELTLGLEFREVFYGEILAMLAPPQTHIEFEFSSLPLVPSFGDFFYLSIVIGTGNIPSEITPLALIARVSVWAQLVFSYLMLGVFIGVIANIVGNLFRQGF